MRHLTNSFCRNFRQNSQFKSQTPSSFTQPIYIYCSLLIRRFFLHFPRIAQPVFLGKLVEYYTPKHGDVEEHEAYLYAGAVVLCSALNVFVVHPYMQAILHMGMKFRVACCSLIYRKVSSYLWVLAFLLVEFFAA